MISHVIKQDGTLRLTEAGYPGSTQVNWNSGDDTLGGLFDLPEHVVHEFRVAVKEGKADAPLACPPVVVEHEVLAPDETHVAFQKPAEVEAPLPPVADKPKRKGK